MTLVISKPTVGGDPGTWGTELNAALDAIVAGVNAAAIGTAFAAKTGDYQPSSNQVSASSASYIGVASGTMTFVPFLCTSTQTFDRLAVNVGVALAGGATVALRQGIYNDNGLGFPGARLLDAGVVSLASIAVATSTISQILTPGLFWLATLFTFVTVPTALSLYTIAEGAPPLPGPVYTNNYRGYTASGVAAGAMPANAPTLTASVPNIVAQGLRAA